MMSKAELARKAGLSTLTIDRVEAGRPCRLDTKRKILLALGLKVSDKDRVFDLGREPGRRSDMVGSQAASARRLDVRSEAAHAALDVDTSREATRPWRSDR